MPREKSRCEKRFPAEASTVARSPWAILRPAAPDGPELGPEEEGHPAHPQHRPCPDDPRHGRAEEEARAEQVQEHQQGEEHCDEPGGEVLLATVDEHVVEPEEQHPEQRQARVVGRAEAERDTAHGAPSGKQERGQGEAPPHRELGRDAPELELDGEPGGPPDDARDGEQGEIRRGAALRGAEGYGRGGEHGGKRYTRPGRRRQRPRRPLKARPHQSRRMGGRRWLLLCHPPVGPRPQPVLAPGMRS